MSTSLASHTAWKGQPASLPDTVHLVNLQLPPQKFKYLNDLWDRPADISPQPVTVTVEIYADLFSTALTDGRDSLVGTVNYGTASKAVLALVSPAADGAAPIWEGVEHLTEAIARLLLVEQGAPSVRITLSLPRALLACDALEFVGEWHRSTSSHSQGESKHIIISRSQQYVVRALNLNTLIGLNPCERKELQPISVTLRFDATLPPQPCQPASRPAWNPRDLISTLSKFIVQSTSYGTVETLSTQIVTQCFGHEALATGKWAPDTDKPQPQIDRIAVRVDKPSAVALASAAGAEVVRERGFLNGLPHPMRLPSFFEEHRYTKYVSSDPDQQWWTVLLSLGSNLGARSAFIHSALRLLRAARRVPGGSGHEQWKFVEDKKGDGLPLCMVADTSFMYETAPMYVEDQPRFLNAAARIQTRLSPFDLLDLTQAIEARLGRDHAASLAMPKGPRVVDLDMIWHSGATNYTHLNSADHDSTATPAPALSKPILRTPCLTLPHIGLAEREFVLRPLADIEPRWRHPVHGRTVGQMLAALKPDAGMRRVLPIRVPLPAGGSVREHPASQKTLGVGVGVGETEVTLPFPAQTYVMSIINTTPDSFSDGGRFAQDDVARTVRTAREMVGGAGADMVDIGGMSTAPGRPDVEEREESARVVPVVRGIRLAEAEEAAAAASSTEPANGGSVPAGTRLPTIISIDTFRPSVARAALDAGASLINDVTGARGTWSDADADADDGTERSNKTGDEMLALVAERGVPIVLMHMRGTSRTMTSAANTTYASQQPPYAHAAADPDPDPETAVVQGVREELRICVERALRAGVPRWNIVLDPGIGFAKTREGSLALIRRVGELTAPGHEGEDVRRCRVGEKEETEDEEEEDATGLGTPNLSLRNMPILLGASRKRFLAPTTAYTSSSSSSSSSSATATATPDPRDRVFSTAAACAAGVASGCVDIVRVHDTREMVDVVRTADAIFRRPSQPVARVPHAG
ncbi:trifunctional dihydropteroate synthetase [Tilletia horrida]|nr:trifunctional dihydropteroate synthetase [Tilletia horrida]